MKKILFLLLLFPGFRVLHARPAAADTSSTERRVIQWRRHIHRHPELSFEEYRTAAFVDSLLRSMGGIEVSRPTPTSVVGILRGGKPGKTIGLRADMDALPVEEETHLPFASVVDGVSHACGHDAHTAILLGTASVLAPMKDTLPGTVYFIFQPGEEKAPGGAKGIIASGALKGLDAIFGLHLTPNFPVGHIGILPAGAASTASDGFLLTIHGKGSHGSMPQLGIDPIVVGSDLVLSLQTIISRNVDPAEMAVLSVGKFQAGNAPNVIPPTAELGATIRTVSDTTRHLIAERVKAMVEYTAKAYGATYDLNYIFSYPAIQNDAALCELARRAAVQALGAAKVAGVPRMSASEDFSYYREVAPICFLLLGVGDGPANHNPKFNPDEKAFIDGVKTEVRIVLDYLGAGNPH